MGCTWHDFQDAEEHREANDRWFGTPDEALPLELPATMDEIIQRRNGTDDDPEGMFS